MPIKKSFRKKTTKRKVYKKRPIKASYARSVVIRGSETKELRYFWADTMDTDTSTTHLSMMKYHNPVNTAEGDQVNQRVGSKVFGKYVELNISFAPTTNTTDCYAVRVFFVRLPTGTPLVYSSATGPANFANMYQNSAFADMYPDSSRLGLCQYPSPCAMRVLWSKTYCVAGRSNSNSQHYPSCIHVKKRLPINKTISYLEGTASNAGTYLILFHCINLDGHADANVLAFTGYTRFIYKDY